MNTSTPTGNIIASTNHYIVLDRYTKAKLDKAYQSERELESELISDLTKQGFEHRTDITDNQSLERNIKQQIERLNGVVFNDNEWGRFLDEYLFRPNDTKIDKSHKIHHNSVYDFEFDDTHRHNIKIIDKQDLHNNHVQVISQMCQAGKHKNRYDVSILVNGLPLVQIELKRRGVGIREAFGQISRYEQESLNGAGSWYRYVQIFVISNGTHSRYFANTTKRDQKSFDFSMTWATADNQAIHDLKDFTATFLSKRTLLAVLCKYSVLDSQDNLLIMRPYQIAATERILWKISSSFHAKQWSKPAGGGYIWHTTGSGKTLTSFKVAQLATELDFIDKVLFVVDRKDLDYQTMQEYQKFAKDSVNGSKDTQALKQNLANDDNKIVVTTIQKLHNLLSREKNLPIYQKQVVLIFDECHRSQFGDAQKNITKMFKKYYQFGFTGTPIFGVNAVGNQDTAEIFGTQLHAYTITDAIKDEKVLKFKIDYHNVTATFKHYEQDADLLIDTGAIDGDDGQKLSAAEYKKMLAHPERIRQIAQYLLQKYPQKTHQNQMGSHKGFNAMFAVGSVDMAKAYYEAINHAQAHLPKDKRLTVATIYSFGANEEVPLSAQMAGQIEDEEFEPQINAQNSTAKAFLAKAIDDYNATFATNFSLDGQSFNDYYKDLSQRIKKRQVDLVIVVGMFLTGFDAPHLNTLFVDKNLRYHGLIQAFSRTNRILDNTKAFGNIVCFRDLEKATIDALSLFGDSQARHVILQKDFTAQLNSDDKNFLAVIHELNQRFGDIDQISTQGESHQKDFVRLFGDYLRLDNVLKNYDEYTALKAWQEIDQNDPMAVADFRQSHELDDDTFNQIKDIRLPSERQIQDYRSVYTDICQGVQASMNATDSHIIWDDVVFEIELLKSQEIDLDYILALIVKKTHQSTDTLIDEVRRHVRASIEHRAKEDLIVDFIKDTDLTGISDVPTVLDKFYQYAQTQQAQAVSSIIQDEKLDPTKTKDLIKKALDKGTLADIGTDIGDIMLQKPSRLNKNYPKAKQSLFGKLKDLIAKFKGIGGKVE